MLTPTKGPRLGGGPAHERLMLANLATALFEHGKITTTEAKAKRLRPLAERLAHGWADTQPLRGRVGRPASPLPKASEHVLRAPLRAT